MNNEPEVRTERISVRLTKSERKALKQISDKRKKSMSWVLIDILNKEIEAINEINFNKYR